MSEERKDERSRPMKAPTLCWDCRNATGFCPWSSSGTPVEGWAAKKTKKIIQDGRRMDSYIVYDCPMFERDAIKGGLIKYDPDNPPTFPTIRKRKREDV